MHGISSRFRDLIEESESPDLMACLKDTGLQDGLERFGFIAKMPTTNGLGYEPAIETNYPLEWLERYQEKRYDLVDPVFRYGMQNFLPMNWSDVPQDKTAKSFFGESMEFGVYRNGIAIPVRDELNRQSLFSINVDMGDADWESFRKEKIADVTYLAHLFHHYYMLQNCEKNAPRRPLTKRETEVLEWAARGKTTWETAKIMDLSERTIEFYLKNACSKLTAANKTQAVAEALKRAEIDP